MAPLINHLHFLHEIGRKFHQVTGARKYNNSSSFFFNLPKAHFDVNCKNGIFLEPLQWMSPCQSVSENKLHCAKCGSKLGSFAWDTPIKCACGASMAPGFHINLSRVDKCTMHKEIEAVI